MKRYRLDLCLIAQTGRCHQWVVEGGLGGESFVVVIVRDILKVRVKIGLTKVVG